LSAEAPIPGGSLDAAKAVFGINGFVIGPAIAATFIAVWQIRAGARDVPERHA
jgi:predicted PurR-regulated permease PerM